MTTSPQDPLNPGIGALETSGSSEPRGIWKPQLFGALVGLCLGAGLLGWAMAVDLVHLGASRADICRSSEPECALFEGLAEVGANISSEIEAMVLTGVFLATVILVGVGVWVGSLVGRRRRGQVRQRRFANGGRSSFLNYPRGLGRDGNE